MRRMASRRKRAAGAIAVGSLVNRVSEEAMKQAMAARGERGLAAQIRAYKDASEAVNLAGDLAIAYSHGERAGDWPSFEEAAQIEGMPSARTFYRRQKIYREIFGEDADPYELAQAIWREFAPRLAEDGPAIVADLPASLFPLA